MGQSKPTFFLSLQLPIDSDKSEDKIFTHAVSYVNLKLKHINKSSDFHMIQIRMH